MRKLALRDCLSPIPNANKWWYGNKIQANPISGR